MHQDNAAGTPAIWTPDAQGLLLLYVSTRQMTDVPTHHHIPTAVDSCNGKSPTTRGQFLCRNTWFTKQTISGALDGRKSPLQMKQTFNH